MNVEEYTIFKKLQLKAEILKLVRVFEVQTIECVKAIDIKRIKTPEGFWLVDDIEINTGTID